MSTDGASTGDGRVRGMDSEAVLLRPEKAAERCDISRAQLYRLLRDGEIESIYIGRSRRVPVVALDEFVERKRAEAAGVMTRRLGRGRGSRSSVKNPGGHA